jgi:hypothetical protein
MRPSSSIGSELMLMSLVSFAAFFGGKATIL